MAVQPGVIAHSRQILAALAAGPSKSTAWRSLAISLLGAVALGALAAWPAEIAIKPAPAASSGWLDRLNSWRASTGLATLTENPTWSQGDYDHAVYMVKDDLVTHYEIPGNPNYTIAGDTAARNSNIYVSSSTSTTDVQAIDWWMQAPFHAMGLMDPRLSQTGFGSYRQVKTGWQLGAAVDTLRGNSFTGGNYPVYFPGNGTHEPLGSYGGGEFPDPLQGCPGYSVPTGLPVFVQVGGNVATTAGAVHSFTGNGVPLAHCVIDSHNPAVGSNLVGRGGVIIIPRQPLQTGVSYSVALTVNGAPYTWSFTVGPFTACASVNVSATPTNQAAPGTPVAFRAVGGSCPDLNPLYQFWILAPGASAYTLAQAYSTSPTLNWITTGKAAGAYAVSVWVRDANSAGVSTNSFGSWDAYSSSTYKLGAPVCTWLSASATPPASAAIGTPVKFTASGICPDPNSVYQFWILAPGATSYTLAQAYSTSPTLNWSTSAKATGMYAVSVWVRDANSAGTFSNGFGTWDAYSSSTYALVTRACTGLSVAPAPASATTIGTPVTFTAGGICPDSSPAYQFWILAPGASSYTLAQAYSTGPTLSWSTKGKVAGTYTLSVWVRDARSAGAFNNSFGTWDAYSSSTYGLS